MKLRCSREIVEADDRDVIRHSQAGGEEGRHCADGAQVIAGEHGGGPVLHRHQLLCRVAAAGRRVVTAQHKRRIPLKTKNGHRIVVGPVAILRRPQLFLAADEGDPAMAQGRQVLHGGSGAAVVVRRDGREFGVLAVMVDRDDGQVRSREALHKAELVGQHGDHAIGELLQQLQHLGRGPLVRSGPFHPTLRADFFPAANTDSSVEGMRSPRERMLSPCVARCLRSPHGCVKTIRREQGRVVASLGDHAVGDDRDLVEVQDG